MAKVSRCMNLQTGKPAAAAACKKCLWLPPPYSVLPGQFCSLNPETVRVSVVFTCVCQGPVSYLSTVFFLALIIAWSGCILK